MRTLTFALSSALKMVAFASLASAASLQVSPVNIEVQAPGAASTVTLLNLGKDVINPQVRVFKWSQSNGKDELTPTRDVVASPPAVKMTAGKKSVIRIVRTNKTPITGEEDYRLVVDEIPAAPKAGATGVDFAVRYSIPVFFTTMVIESNIGWKATIDKSGLRLQAKNDGDRRVKVSALQVSSKSGASINFGDGLVGYVLGHSTRQWTVKAGSKSITPGTIVNITAQSDNGPIKATAMVLRAN